MILDQVCFNKPHCCFVLSEHSRKYFNWEKKRVSKDFFIILKKYFKDISRFRKLWKYLIESCNYFDNIWKNLTLFWKRFQLLKILTEIWRFWKLKQNVDNILKTLKFSKVFKDFKNVSTRTCKYIMKFLQDFENFNRVLIFFDMPFFWTWFPWF